MQDLDRADIRRGVCRFAGRTNLDIYYKTARFPTRPGIPAEVITEKDSVTLSVRPLTGGVERKVHAETL